MKKQLFALAALVIAIGALAFTFPSKRASETFIFNGDPTVSGDVSTLSNWSRFTGTVNCPGGNQKACVITSVDELYYDASFNLNATAIAPEQVMTISQGSFTSGGSTTYYATSPASGTTDNQQR
jgi:hypothetical protein